MEHDQNAAPTYPNQPDCAIAALLQMLARYPMTWCDPLAASIGSHFDYVAADERYSNHVRVAAARAGAEWRAMLAMQRELGRQRRKLT